MRVVRRIALMVCVLALGAGAAFAGINSKEVGALLVYPEYYATLNAETGEPNQFTLATITNDKSSPVNAHIEVIGERLCGDCNFDLPLTGFQTKNICLQRELDPVAGYVTKIYDNSVSPRTLITACPERRGFIVATLEAPGVEPRKTLGENMLHGDEVVFNSDTGAASQVGALAVQGIGPNDGDRNYRFDNVEYAAFPSIVTADFYKPTFGVDPHLILLNVNFTTGLAPFNTCSINYTDAEERVFSSSFQFRCWRDARLTEVASGFASLADFNGFLWAQCSPGTHGALMTHLFNDDFKDTLFQSVTTNASAVLHLTPSITGTP